eukprot:Protomagalhaensia_sp_Gyna_25__463@NODE_121_length_5100_cov_18_313179_g95_i0_p2_GENE_NODE_121_length_5100_cov_18_313179_g95_i0NODE_121_length_5100_cov_18_313179_g95_i0_p2_ORF_typecomplete_len720_score199_17Ndc80_HEC/PF03801_13/0_00013Ndc80_HEC/PF03801_13/8_4e03MgtE_N/PF03448_17/0_013MgtE_N/PF03448_17/35FlaC_arch/PF05377_11/0_26FlaC_arch/PF05377_11/7_1e02Leu_zip/PF15294_6/0_0053Leu_zip/PF15294_6/1_8e04DUF3584/PF12128_8/0_0047DUF3584/PF12128_8/3_2HAUSaugmin3/PF14932_6/1_4e02HAUSaugmin3/PF14932_6/1_
MNQTPTPARSGVSSRNAPSLQREELADLYECADSLLLNLKELGYGLNYSAQELAMATHQPFVEIANIIFKSIDPSSTIENLDTLQPAIRYLQGPGPLPKKSQWNTPGPLGRQLIPLFSWLVQLVLFESATSPPMEVPKSEWLAALRHFSENPRSGREMDLLDGVLSYVEQVGLLEDPSIGEAWREYQIEDSDIQTFIESLARMDPATLEIAWQHIVTFHAHMIYMMGRTSETFEAELKEQENNLMTRLEVYKVFDSDLSNLDMKIKAGREDLSTAKKQLDDMNNQIKQMMDESSAYKDGCALKQQESNKLNEELCELRHMVSKQGISATEAETRRAHTTSQMTRARDLQQQCLKVQVKIKESEIQLAEEFKSYAPVWKDFVCRVINTLECELPAEGDCSNLFQKIRSQIETAGDNERNRRLLISNAGYLLEYSKVKAVLSNYQQTTEKNVLDILLKMRTDNLLDMIRDLDQEVQDKAVQQLQTRIKEREIRQSEQKNSANGILTRLQRELEESEKEHRIVLRQTEHLEVIKSDREKALDAEVRAAEAEYKAAQQKHALTLAQQADKRSKWRQEILEFTQAIEEQQVHTLQSQRDFEMCEAKHQASLQELSKQFKEAIVGISVALPEEILEKFPKRLKRELGLKDLAAVLEEMDDTEVAVVEAADASESSGIEEDEEEEDLTPEPVLENTETGPGGSTGIKPVKKALQNIMERLQHIADK